MHASRNQNRIAAALALFTLLGSSAAIAGADCGTPATPADSIALVKNFYQAFNTKNKSQLDTVLSPDWIDIPLAPGQGQVWRE